VSSEHPRPLPVNESRGVPGQSVDGPCLGWQRSLGLRQGCGLRFCQAEAKRNRAINSLAKASTFRFRASHCFFPLTCLPAFVSYLATAIRLGAAERALRPWPSSPTILRRYLVRTDWLSRLSEEARGETLDLTSAIFHFVATFLSGSGVVPRQNLVHSYNAMTCRRVPRQNSTRRERI